MSQQLFLSQNIYYIYIGDLLKNLSLQMYATASVSLSHIHNRESATVRRGDLNIKVTISKSDDLG